MQKIYGSKIIAAGFLFIMLIALSGCLAAEKRQEAVDLLEEDQLLIAEYEEVYVRILLAGPSAERDQLLELLAAAGAEAQTLKPALMLVVLNEEEEGREVFQVSRVLQEIDEDLRGLWGMEMRDYLQMIELENLQWEDGLATAELKLEDPKEARAVLSELEVSGKLVFSEVFYQRNYRGSRELTEEKIKEVTFLDSSGFAELKNEGYYEVEVPAELPFQPEDEYRDGNLEAVLEYSLPQKEEQKVKLTEESTALTYGRPWVVVNPEHTHQPIDGFGASGAWWAQDVGGWEEARDQIADLLFSKDKGIALSQYRYNAKGGVMPQISDPWRTGETFEVDQGEYDWSRDENARWMLRAAQKRGVEEFILFTKTPPARITKNKKTYADPGSDSNLAPENYDQFARYLIDIYEYFKSEEGIAFDWISPINEPEWDWDDGSQEGTPYTVSQIQDLSQVILDKMEEHNLEAELLIPETGAWEFVHGGDRSYADNLLGHSELGDRLEVLAAHSYWSTDTDRRRAARALEDYPEHRIWQTEWCEMVHGRDLGMDFALNLVNTVHSDLTTARASAWQFWLAVSKGDYRDGLVYVDEDTREVTAAQGLWALGNFSRFIRPGSVRIDVDSNHGAEPEWQREAGVEVSAYLGPQREELIVVAINETPGEVTTELVVEQDSREAVLTPYRTSEKEALAELEPLVLKQLHDEQIGAEIKLAAESVTTFVGRIEK